MCLYSVGLHFGVDLGVNWDLGLNLICVFIPSLGLRFVFRIRIWDLAFEFDGGLYFDIDFQLGFDFGSGC